LRIDQQKKCYICQKPNCWSNQHTLQERKEAYNKFCKQASVANTRADKAYFQSFLAHFKGPELLSDNVHREEELETNKLLKSMQIKEFSDQYITNFGKIDGFYTMTILNNQLALYCFTKTNFFNQSVKVLEESSTFSFDNCYSSSIFYSIMLNIGTAGVRTSIQEYV
jgi:hypothetical protein